LPAPAWASSCANSSLVRFAFGSRNTTFGSLKSAAGQMLPLLQ
jgi:hypothetical protein